MPAPTHSISLVQLVRVEHSCPRADGPWGPSERERFCDVCNLHVHNLSARTEPEAEALLTASGDGRLCVRYEHDHSGRPITCERLPAPPRSPFFIVPIARGLSRLAALIGLAALATTLAALAGCTTHTGGVVARPSDSKPMALGGKVAQPNNLTPSAPSAAPPGLTTRLDKPPAAPAQPHTSPDPHSDE